MAAILGVDTIQHTNGTTAVTVGTNGSVTAAGNVGIGETASANLLHVKASDTGITPHASAQIVLEREGTNYLQFLTAENGTSGCLFGDGSDIDAGKISYDHNIPAMQFQVESAERMRIDASGNVLVGTSNASPYNSTSGNGIALKNGGDLQIAVESGESLYVNRMGSDGRVVSIRKAGAFKGGIDVSSSGVTYNSTSDYRLKENVDYTWDATTRLKQLKPARFNFIADDTNTLVDGFLAHEVSSIVPEAISGAKDAVDADNNPDYQGIDQSKLVPLLVKTIQELEARITALEAK